MIFTSNRNLVSLSKYEQRRIENAPSFSLNKIVQIFIPRCFNLGISKRLNTSKKHWARMEDFKGFLPLVWFWDGCLMGLNTRSIVNPSLGIKIEKLKLNLLFSLLPFEFTLKLPWVHKEECGDGNNLFFHQIAFNLCLNLLINWVCFICFNLRHFDMSTTISFKLDVDVGNWISGVKWPPIYLPTLL